MDPITWLVLAIIGIVGAIYTAVTKKSAAVPLPPAVSDVAVKAEAEATKEDAVAVEKHDEVVAEAEKEHDAENTQLVQDLESGQTKLLEDNGALTDYLKDVGNKTRGGS